MLEDLFGNQIFRTIELWPAIFATCNTPDITKVRTAVLVQVGMIIY